MIRGKSNLVLIGFMGSGKSMVARDLGRKLGKTVVSTDEMIVRQENRAIAEIFEHSGEAYFRRLEEETVSRIAQLRDVIVDCGGGIVLNQGNIDRLKENGCLIYLSASPAFLYEMIKHQKHRPLVNVQDPLQTIRELLEQRRDRYEQAHITIVSEGKTIDQICGEIFELMKND